MKIKLLIVAFILFYSFSESNAQNLWKAYDTASSNQKKSSKANQEQSLGIEKIENVLNLRHFEVNHYQFGKNLANVLGSNNEKSLQKIMHRVGYKVGGLY